MNTNWQCQVRPFFKLGIVLLEALELTQHWHPSNDPLLTVHHLIIFKFWMLLASEHGNRDMHGALGDYLMPYCPTLIHNDNGSRGAFHTST